ncbi:MAG: hypothetical protein HRT44_01855 [Bdellovibrionales bacterium]|nr:hypothetical protein [Bdellovibrionales bacterium]
MAQADCDDEIMKSITNIFVKKEPTKIHRCLHITDVGKVVTIVEPRSYEGAISLFVFEERGLNRNSKALSSVKAFSVDGLAQAPTRGKGLKIKSGFGYFYREAFKEGVLVLHYKNENSYYDVSLIRLNMYGELENMNLSGQESESLMITQAENRDIYTFKVHVEETIDIFPGSEKVEIDHRWKAGQKREFSWGLKLRAPASTAKPNF